MSIVWLSPRSEPVPAMQWTGINADDLVDLTEGVFTFEVTDEGSALGLVNGEEVPLGHFLVSTSDGWAVLSPENVRSKYDAL